MTAYRSRFCALTSDEQVQLGKLRKLYLASTVMSDLSVSASDTQLYTTIQTYAMGF